MRERLSDFLVHLSWAFYGNECAGCGGRFTNWLARTIGEGRYDPIRFEPRGFSRVTWWIGDTLMSAAGRVMPH